MVNGAVHCLNELRISALGELPAPIAPQLPAPAASFHAHSAQGLNIGECVHITFRVDPYSLLAEHNIAGKPLLVRMPPTTMPPNRLWAVLLTHAGVCVYCCRLAVATRPPST